MRILHLSDIHLSKNNIKDFKSYYLKSLLNTLNDIHKQKEIDLVVITGDLVDKGGHSFGVEKAYSVFDKEFLRPINTELNLGLKKFIFIPGNHDINEELIDEYIEEGIKRKLSSIEKVNDFIDTHYKGKAEALLRNKNFKSFEGKYFKGVKEKNISNFESVFMYEIHGKKVGIACFNSSWRCSQNLSPDELLLGTRQILNANDFFEKRNADFVIALVHHPIDNFSFIERTEINTLFQKLKFDMLLMGHIHEGKTLYSTGNMGTLYTSVSKSSFNNPREKIDDFKPGFIIYDIDIDLFKITASYYKYSHKLLQFVLDTDLYENGSLRTDLVPPKERKPFLELLKLNNKSLEVYRPEINSSLLISGTQTIAPQNLDDIFVLPRLSEQPFNYNIDSISKPEFLTIDEILSWEKNILFFGSKEIGKTTLLNKIYLDLGENIAKYKKIPILLDYKDLRNKKLKSLISKYLNEPLRQIELLLKRGEIIILIDNFEENESSKHSKTSLREFMSLYKKVTILGTTLEKFEIVINKNDSFFDIGNFKPVFIGYVSVKEFKNLAQNWFARNNPEWISDNLEKLIKVFEILRIPRTFFSISLFLWIIEKQENYKPVNKDNLIHQFLIYILEGLKIENSEAGSYNFNKKVELLTEIALTMFKNGDRDNEYALKEFKVLETIKNNFELNQRTWSVNDKLKEFIDKGVLKVDASSNVIKFRYQCFFEYFLSFSISNNEEFKEYVFSDSEFLSFVEEIDYYTARSQSDVKALKWVFEKLEDSFQKVDNIISEDFDNYLPEESLFLRELKTKENEVMPEIRKNKLSDEEIESILNEEMEKLPVNDSIQVKEQMDLKLNFPIVLELAARVLKNSENIKDPKLINSSLDIIIKKTIKYSIFFQSLLAKNLFNKFEAGKIKIEKKEDLQNILIVPFFPLVSQVLLYTWVGTEFLTVPLQKKLKDLKTTGKTVLSEFELFITTFLYSDLKLPDSNKKVDTSISLLTSEAVVELFFMKIFLYYMFKPESSPELPVLEKQMKKLIAEAKGIPSKSAEIIVNKSIKKIKSDFRTNHIDND